ncbi:MAG TPA: phosphoserine transaminase [Acidimicrobiia bacterium]
MPDRPEIQLPAELLPIDGRFGSGPSKVRLESLLELGVSGSTYMGTSHRQDRVKKVVHRIRAGLSELYNLPAGFEVLLGVGGATAFWDAAAFGLIERRSQHLVFGEFSAKFASVVAGAPHLDEPELIESDPGTHPHPAARQDVDVYAFTHNETSTGVMMPIARPEGADGLVVVDATSAAGAAHADVDQFDVYYFSPQKAFGSDGGLWIALCSPFAVSRIERLASSERWIPPFLDLRTALDNSRKDQTYNTPALATLFLLDRQIAVMHELGGLDWAVKRSKTSSETVYAWADASVYAAPFVTDPAMRSSTVVTVDLVPEVSADVVEGVLRDNGILDTFGYRKLGRNQLRIACFPNVDPTDVEKLTRAVDHIIERL